MNPTKRPQYEVRMYKKLAGLVERCCCASKQEQMLDCIEMLELEDLMLEIAEEAFELLLFQLDIKVIPRMPIQRIESFLGQLASRAIELAAEDKLDDNWAKVAAATVTTKLWTYGEGLAVEHARTRVTQYKAFPAGMFNLFREFEARRRIVSVWVAEAGACEICSFLNGNEIEDIFEDGPPAHPNCRCHLEHGVEQ